MQHVPNDKKERSLLDKTLNIDGSDGLDGEVDQVDSENGHFDRETTRNRP